MQKTLTQSPPTLRAKMQPVESSMQDSGGSAVVAVIAFFGTYFIIYFAVLYLVLDGDAAGAAAVIQGTAPADSSAAFP